MKKLLSNWKVWAAGALAAFVAFNTATEALSPGLQHMIVALGAALGIVSPGVKPDAAPDDAGAPGSLTMKDR